MTHSEHEMRLSCLRLAEQRFGGNGEGEVIRVARLYADFVLGTKDAAIIRKAADLAATVHAADSVSAPERFPHINERVLRNAR